MSERRGKQSLPTRKVLLIDDDELIRALMKLYLTGLGEFEYWEAWDGKSGLSIAEQVIPDLIIADLMMPLMDGVAFTEELRKRNHLKDIPVLIVTGANDELKTKAYAAGANMVLEKPLNRKAMLSAFQNLFPK